ncbi:variable surface protein [Plasmodium gonderi]|uniref:Variable surface protein n=1 Tax=Plasmodium gonderi TaxID=77519 RepID=A0A1Y1JUL7_PLAGO|nr:variable surface protein [Plasmodium gonderi]GAW84103.1 variable surface protein [Plasmodium gonderi]
MMSFYSSPYIFFLYRKSQSNTYICIYTCSCTFGKSWNNWVNQANCLNFMRTSRLLIGETSLERARGREFAYLKDRINDLLNEDDDDVFGKRLNDLEHDVVFRKKFNKLIYDESYQKKLDALNDMNGNLDLSFDNIINSHDQNNELKKKKKLKRNNSLDLDNFYDEDSFEYKNDNFPNLHMQLETYHKSKKPKKTFQYGKKNKKSTSLGKNKFDAVLEPDSLKEIVMKTSTREERASEGFMDTLKRLDKEFEVELLRAIKKKSFSDYEECKFKTYKGKKKYIMRILRIYLPPTVLMAILMIMIIFPIFFNEYIFAFLSLVFFALATYYEYKFTKMNRINDYTNKILLTYSFIYFFATYNDGFMYFLTIY